MASYQANLKVWRGDASGGGLRDYTVEVQEGEVVLDVLHRIQAPQAGDLAVRWNCKATASEVRADRRTFSTAPRLTPDSAVPRRRFLG